LKKKVLENFDEMKIHNKSIGWKILMT
jgi:hypothetical protein